MTPLRGWFALAACVALVLTTGCSRHADGEASNASGAADRARNAETFVARANVQLEDLRAASARAWMAARTTSDAAMRKIVADNETNRFVLLDRLIEESTGFDGQALKPETARAIQRLRLLSVTPVPHDATKIAEIAAITVRLRTALEPGIFCKSDDEASCHPQADVPIVLDNGRDYDERLEAWSIRHKGTATMRKDYARFVELANDGAKRLGFANAGEYARARYDMDADALQTQTDRLWSQVKPMYYQLQCYTRLRLMQHYGPRAQADGMIRAHLADGFRPADWNDQWDLLAPYPDAAKPAADAQSPSADAIDLVMRSREGQPFLFRHRDGDPLATALVAVGSMARAAGPENVANPASQPGDPRATINAQMRTAFDVFATLAFAMTAEHWRWGVFDGSIKPADYNKAWWAMRAKYEGIAPPSPRDERTFDAGATFGIADNYPQIGLFLAGILQFQIDRALCKSANGGSKYGCDMEHDARTVQRYRTMLERDESQPWQKRLKEFTGDDRIDAGAMLEYFAPLLAWLDRQSKSAQCGWEGNFASGPATASVIEPTTN